MKRGFTLVETLVTAAIIAILIGIAVPSLSNARRVAQVTSSKAIARSTGGLFLSYAADHDAKMFAGEIDDPARNWYTNWNGEKRWFFDTHISWSSDIGGNYVPSGDPGEFNSPFDRLDEKWGDYEYSCCLTTQPQFWNPLTRFGPSQWSAPRLDQSVYASRKILTFDGVLWDQVQAGKIDWKVKKPLIASFLDGSADAIVFATPGYFKGDGVGDWPGTVHSGQTNNGLHTIDGIRGFDR